jgi:secreted Zn-dependent insulinase-like peptidase
VKIAKPALRKPLSTLVLILLALLAACQPIPPKAPGEPIQSGAAQQATSIATSDNDPRSYRYLELPNHLRVLLISAPGSDKAAAALDVNVGSRQDPADRQGLAHFLEHMLFLGTDRYPESGEYQRFISTHGGNHNAFTAFEDTNYFFDIDSRYLEEALDRFSRFFVAPLFSAEYVEREKHAVHSEYKGDIRNDMRRSYDVLRDVVNPDHPLAKFSVGSLDTLADRPGSTTRDELLKFYQQYYSANLMTLVVFGREPLDELQRMVSSRFADVPNHDRTIEPVAAPLFAPGSLPQRVRIEPVKDEYAVAYTWPIGDQHDDYRGKSLEYIGNLLGHEGDGSLLSYLKQRGWAQGLSAGQGIEYQGGATFNINISLTEAGSKHIDEITLALYQAIGRVRESGVQQWLYDEQKAVAQQRFRFRDLPAPDDEVTRLAGNLHDYPPAEVIRGDYLMTQFEPERIGQLLAQLAPQRMLMMVTAPRIETDRRSTYYAAPYSVQTPTATELQAWQQAAPNAAIRLPEPNIFIAADLSLKAPPAVAAAAPPKLVQDGPGLHLWFLQDSVFHLPKASITIDIRSPQAGSDARSAVASELLVRVLRENLNEYSYPAALAGLSYDIGRSSRGITVSVQGFNDKAALLLERILDTLRQPQIDPATLARVAAEYRRQLQDSSKLPPRSLLMKELNTVLQRNQWPDAALLPYIQTTSAARLQEHAAQLLAQIDVDALVYGNLAETDARSIGDLLQRKLLAGATPATVPPVAILQLPATARRHAVAAPHDDAGLLLYRQAADNAKSTRAALGISAQMLASDFFDQLRTEQQLGYAVQSFPLPIRDVPGLVFLTQSPVAGPAPLAAAYQQFFQRWAQRPAAELQPLFERHRQVLAQRLAETPKNFGEANERLWFDLSSGYKQFDSRAQILAAVQALTFEQWLPLFQRDVLAPQGHALWLSADGRFKTEPLREGMALGGLEAFKRDQHYYLFP